MDVISSTYHATTTTHMDSLCHYIFEGKTYNGWEIEKYHQATPTREGFGEGPGCMKNSILGFKDGLQTLQQFNVILNQDDSLQRRRPLPRQCAARPPKRCCRHLKRWNTNVVRHEGHGSRDSLRDCGCSEPQPKEGARGMPISNIVAAINARSAASAAATCAERCDGAGSGPDRALAVVLLGPRGESRQRDRGVFVTRMHGQSFARADFPSEHRRDVQRA